MDYNQRSRGQKSGAGHPARAPRRSVSSRMGLEKRGAPAQQPPRGNAPRPNQQRGPNQPPRSGQPPRQNRPGQNQPNNGRRPRPQQQINQQKSGYTPGSPRRQRRVTQAEILRRTRRRRFLGMLAVLAVALAPAGVRGLLACVALLPMPLQLAASLSPDASVLGMVFCYMALCLRLRRKRAVWWEKILLIALGGAVGPAKAIYLPVVLLCFLIPVENLMGSTEFVKGPFGARVRSGRLIQAAALILAGCLWISANLGELVYAARDISLAVLVVGVAALAAAVGLVLWLYDKVHTDPKKLCLFRCGLGCTVVLAVGGGVFALSHMGGGLEPDQLLMTNPNGDSIWTFSLGYICRNLPATTKLLLRTIPEQGALWLQGILGTTLGEPIVYRIDVSWLLGVGLVLALLAAALPVQGTDAPLGRRTKIGVVGIILCVVASSLVVALNWTPINYQTLFGLQGRYWLPILPLVLVLCKCGRNITLRHDTSRGAALAVTACTLLTLLQGFGLYASWQPVS